jgi:hypothetical protein
MSEQKKMNWIGLALVVAVLLLVYVLFLEPKAALLRSVSNGATDSRSVASNEKGPSFKSCPVFPADNVWNTRVDGLPKSPLSATFADSIGPLHSLHPDFGTSSLSGIPITTVPAGTPGVSVSFDYEDDSDKILYPIPADAEVEGGMNGMGDRHIILVDTSTCLLYELFAAEKKGGDWKAGSGIVMDLTGNALRAEHKTSADAAGLPILPGLLRYDEVASGEVAHALRFTLPQTQAAYTWPARHFASKLTSGAYPVMGQRFRLRSNFDEKRFSPEVQVIVKALKQYGMILADNGGALYISGVSDSRWNNDDLHKLADIKAEDLEAVDESSLQLLPDSARVNPAALHR